MKFVLVFMAALFVTSFSVCAAELDSDQYYDLDPVQLSPMTASVLDYGVSLAADASWSTTDSQTLGYILDELEDIKGYFYLNKSANNGSLLWSIRSIADDVLHLDTVIVPNMYNTLGEINDVLQNDTYNILDILQSVWNDLGYLREDFSSVESLLYTYFSSTASYPFRNGPEFSHLVSWSEGFASILQHLTFDGYAPWTYDYYTLFHYVRNLGEVLASEDDKILAESQKANREEIEESFLGGSSGNTSLGPSDFGNLSDVGGSVKDMLSLDGNASITSFVSGISSADSAGSGWFSEETRSQLDAVTSSASTYSRSDPYNMSGWQDRYYWLIGDDENG